MFELNLDFKLIDFASRFPPRQLEPRALELDLGTLKIESGACDLPPEGSEKIFGEGFIKFHRVS